MRSARWERGRRFASRVASAGITLAAIGPVLIPTSASAAAPVTTATPLPAADAERLAAYDEALVAVTQELSYLVLLGWVETPIPASARDLPAAIGITASEPAEMIDELRFLDGQRGPAALDALVSLGVPVTDAVRIVLGPNVPGPQEPPPRLGVGVYLTAYDALLGPWAELSGLGAAPAPTTVAPAPVATAPPTAAPTVPATTPATTPSVPVADESPTPSVATRPVASEGAASDGPDAVVIAAGVGLVAVVGTGALVAVLHRRRARGDRPARHDDVVDAGRTIMTAVDLDGFGRTVAAQVRRLAGGDGAAVLHGRSWTTGQRPMPSNDDLTRVLSTARPLTTATATIVPVVADGTVVGALVAWDAPASATDLLATFAPLVGAALQGLQTRLTHEHLAFDDSLTGVGNRRRFDRDLEQLLVPGSRGPVSLAMVDVDHFKRFNDAHGHPAGDLVLRHVAGVIRANVRDGDVVYRYGGEEFAVLLPGADLDEALRVVERVRAAVASSPLPGDVLASVPPVTVSVGVSAAPPVDAASMVRAADGALYAAKSAGRNRVSACDAS